MDAQTIIESEGAQSATAKPLAPATGYAARKEDVERRLSEARDVYLLAQRYNDWNAARLIGVEIGALVREREDIERTKDVPHSDVSTTGKT